MEVDVVAIAGMIFSLLVVLVIGGFILLYPLSRKLGQVLEARLEERRAGRALPMEDVESLRAAVETLREEVGAVAERQRFVERLLESGERGGEGG
jgi:hypothetical protein